MQNSIPNILAKRIYITKVSQIEYQEPKNKDVIYESDIHSLLNNTRGIGEGGLEDI